MERIVEQGFLYDFYGELLTEHQRQIYEDVVLNDLSLSEIAQERGISRQGVHDLVRRCDKALEEYESKLHLVEKFLDTKKQVEEVYRIILQSEAEADAWTAAEMKSCLKQVSELTAAILEHL